jgi:hypothetical protein
MYKGYIGLITSTHEEVFENGYVRGTVLLQELTPSKFVNSNIVTFPEAAKSWGTVVKLLLFDKEVGGDGIVYFNLETKIAVTSGDTVTIPKGRLQMTILEGPHISMLLDTYKEEDKSTNIIQKENNEENHNGQIFNPYTGRYSWL